MEGYLSAAGRISRLAIGTETAPTLAVFDAPHDTSQNTHIEGLPFGTRGGMLIEHEFPADGDYVFTVKGMTGYFTAVLGNVGGEQLEVTIDGERVYLYDWDREIGSTEGNGGRTPAVPIKAGFHRVGVTFIATSDLPDTGLNRSFVRTMNSPGSISGYTFYPHVGQVFIEGPFNGQPAADTQSRDRIFECYPANVSEESECASQIISTLVSKAFRRPTAEGDREPPKMTRLPFLPRISVFKTSNSVENPKASIRFDSRRCTDSLIDFCSSLVQRIKHRRSQALTISASATAQLLAPPRPP
jgi:hypothetical protein